MPETQTIPCICGDVAVWVRHAFTEQYFCNICADLEVDFGFNCKQYLVWETLPGVELTKVHPTSVARFSGTLQELSQDILRMRYDMVELFFYDCATELARQAQGDLERKRFRLAYLLIGATTSTRELALQFGRIFTLCRPHMAGEL